MEVATAENLADLEAELISRLNLTVRKDHRGAVNGVALCENTALVVSAGDDHRCLVYRFNNPSLDEFSLKRLQSYEHHSEEINGCSLDASAARLLTFGYDCRAVITDMTTGQPVWQYQTEDVITAGHISPSGQFVALAVSGGRDLIVLDTTVQSDVHVLKNFHDGKTILSTKWSPNRSRLVSCGTDNTARLYDLRTNKVTLVLKGHTNAVSDATFSANEHWLVTTSWDKTVALWNLSSGSFRHDGPNPFNKGHNSSVSCCSIKPDGSRLVTGGYDRNVIVWDSERGNLTAQLPGCMDWVTDVEITSDGEIVFAVSRDGSLRALSIERAAESRIAACGRRALGVTMVRCVLCSKPYSIGDTTELVDADMRYCVFCRLARREKRQYLADVELKNAP